MQKQCLQAWADGGVEGRSRERSWVKRPSVPVPDSSPTNREGELWLFCSTAPSGPPQAW